MKKRILVISLIIMLYMSLPLYATIGTITGDINGDGRVTVSDLDTLRKFLVHFIELDENGKKVADLNNDGAVDTVDLSIEINRMALLGNPEEENTEEKPIYEQNVTFPENSYYGANLSEKGMEIIRNNYTNENNQNGSEYYVFIKMGSYPNTGYKINLKNVEVNGNEAVIYVETKEPEEGITYANVITTPYILLKFNKKMEIKVEGLYDFTPDEIAQPTDIEEMWDAIYDKIGVEYNVNIENKIMAYKEHYWSTKKKSLDEKIVTTEVFLTDEELEKIQYINSINFEGANWKETVKETEKNSLRNSYRSALTQIAKDEEVLLDNSNSNYAILYNKNIDTNNDGVITQREQGNYTLSIVKEQIEDNVTI